MQNVQHSKMSSLFLTYLIRSFFRHVSIHVILTLSVYLVRFKLRHLVSTSLAKLYGSLFYLNNTKDDANNIVHFQKLQYSISTCTCIRQYQIDQTSGVVCPFNAVYLSSCYYSLPLNMFLAFYNTLFLCLYLSASLFPSAPLTLFVYLFLSLCLCLSPSLPLSLSLSLSSFLSLSLSVIGPFICLLKNVHCSYECNVHACVAKIVPAYHVNNWP